MRVVLNTVCARDAVGLVIGLGMYAGMCIERAMPPIARGAGKARSPADARGIVENRFNGGESV